MATLKELQEMTTEDVLRMARKEVGKYWMSGTLVEATGYEKEWNPETESYTYDFSNVKISGVCALGSLTSVLDLMHVTDGIAYPSAFPASTKKEKRMKKLAMAASEQLYKALPVSAQYGNPKSSHYEDYEDYSHANIVSESIIDYNDADYRHKRTITKWFDRAIALASL